MNSFPEILQNYGLGNSALPKNYFFSVKVKSLRFFNQSLELIRGSTKFPNQNLREIGQGVSKL